MRSRIQMAPDDDETPSISLADVPAREVAGRDTGNKYFYQYKKAAEAAVELLEDGDAKLVFCDMHDDFVIKRLEGTLDVYLFHQVKAKDKKNHLWSFVDVFAVGLTKQFKGSCADGFAWHMIAHQKSFSNQCKGVVLVTNVLFNDDVEEFIGAVLAASTIADLVGKPKKQFSALSDAYVAADPTFTPEYVFAFLKKFKLHSLAGPIDASDNEDASVILRKVKEFSEVDLNLSQSKTVAEELINLVRKRSTAKIHPGISIQELEQKTSVSINDVVSVFPITADAFNILRQAGDQRALLNASILQRFLGRLGYSNELISLASVCKVEWDVWYFEMRHTPVQPDIQFLLARCESLVRQDLSGSGGLSKMHLELGHLLSEFAPKLAVGRPLNSNIVFGAFLSRVVNLEINK
ncbi:MAG: DUF4297 domain-containing protein [Proteobacteria bacterium]|nr:MAG: DUF4297 domain-containing protein [Pseudomonadota bacterium]